MAKIKLTLTLVVSAFSSRWMIDSNPEPWDSYHEEVEIEVNKFKELARMTNNKDELAQLIMDWVGQENSRREYDEFVEDIIKNNWVE